jgi:hypothetical protein
MNTTRTVLFSANKLIPLEPGLSWKVQLGEILHDTARVIRQGRHYYFAFTTAA